MTYLDAQGRIKPLVERLRQACQDGRESLKHWDHDPYLYDEAADEIERLRAALKPFALNPGAVSLSKALGHIGREDLLRAHAAYQQVGETK